VTKHLADVDQFDSATQHLGGQCVPQPVRAHPAARSHARRVTSLTKSGLIPRLGALQEMNTERSEVCGRTSERYAASAWPTSLGSGIPSSREALPRKMIRPPRQSMSLSSSLATSIERSPSRATSIKIA
jgi:hypothetical protein